MTKLEKKVKELENREDYNRIAEEYRNKIFHNYYYWRDVYPARTIRRRYKRY
jgi:hypothetical protein